MAGEGLFFARMLAQWLASEREQKPVIPAVYWYLSLAGAGILVAYALHIGSFAVLLPQAVGVFFYARGLQLEYASRGERGRAFSPGHAGYAENGWPRLSVIVPAHNEEKRLAATLENLTRLEYPGEKPQIIAALNGCTDGSRAIADSVPGVAVIEDPRSGMSFGKNLGARGATGDVFVFVDADTLLPPPALRLLAEAVAGKTRYIGTVAGAPDKGGGVVRACFLLANRATKRKQAHAPGGVMIMDPATFRSAGGFDEQLPQGTSTDCIRRGIKSGAEYVFVDSFKAATSIRRFEKTGIVRQMLAWRKNHKALEAGRRRDVETKHYEDIR